MSLIGWIILGLIAGWIGSRMVKGAGSGLMMNLVLGVVGAVVGGFLVGLLGGSGVTGFNLWSLIVAVFGAVMVLVFAGAVRRR
jgi:uncharacterized membrane protein YeaQ/YmgE (transglycosylase-associated protein family)